MTNAWDEARFFEIRTLQEVQTACDLMLPGMTVHVQPDMFDACVVVKHSPGQGPSLEVADALADHLRRGAPLRPDKADWHVTNFGPEAGLVTANEAIGTSFCLTRTFLPDRDTVERCLAV